MGVYQVTERVVDPGRYPWGVSGLGLRPWSDAEVGDFALLWSFPHAGQAGYKGPNDTLVAAADLGSYAQLTGNYTILNSNSDADGWGNTELHIGYEATNPGRVIAAIEARARGGNYYLPAPNELEGIRSYAVGMGLTTSEYLSSYNISNMSKTVNMGTGIVTSRSASSAYLVRSFRKPDE